MGRDHPPGARRRCTKGSELSGFVDTNVLIRHMTGDPPATASRATAALGSGRTLLLTDLVAAECVYVLESFYEVGRKQIASLLRAAIAMPSLATLSPSLLLRTLEVYETDSLHFVDAYLVAQAEITGVGEVVSFDRGFDRITTVTRREP
ncbi:MAG: PIN domain-containing protein [Solirubrobacterales bacterium]